MEESTYNDGDKIGLVMLYVNDKGRNGYTLSIDAGPENGIVIDYDFTAEEIDDVRAYIDPAFKAEMIKKKIDALQKELEEITK